MLPIPLIIAISDSFLVSFIAAYFTDKNLTERIAIVGDFIGLQKSYNTGIAFGIDLGPAQSIIIFCALIIVTYAAFKTAQSTLEQIGFGLVIGGGLANIVDRMIDGRVTDMIQVGTFPIFNIADACINIGVFLLLVSLIRGKKETNVQHKG